MCSQDVSEDMHGVGTASKAPADTAGKKSKKSVPSSGSSPANDSGPSGLSSPEGMWEEELPEPSAWESGVVNDISPPASPRMVPQFNPALFSLGPSWAYPQFGPSFKLPQ
jgi:hypothetical protein